MSPGPNTDHQNPSTHPTVDPGDGAGDGPGERAGDPTGGPAVPSRAEILDEVRTMIGDIVGEEYLLDIDITPDTRFNDDLELESIEFVALAERLTERYGERVDFVGWMADLELEELIEMTVGRLVDFVHTCLSGETDG